MINDIIESLTDPKGPFQYFKRLKMRDKELAKLMNKGGYNLYHPLCLRQEPESRKRIKRKGTVDG